MAREKWDISYPGQLILPKFNRLFPEAPFTYKAHKRVLITQPIQIASRSPEEQEIPETKPIKIFRIPSKVYVPHTVTPAGSPEITLGRYDHLITNDAGYSRQWTDGQGYLNLAAETKDKKNIILASQNPDVRTYAVVNGKTIDFARSRDTWRDSIFLHNLITTAIQGGAVVIMLDHRDDYKTSADPRNDEGAHYALINTTHFSQGEHRFKRNVHGIIPLPIFTRLLGHGWARQQNETGTDSELVSDPSIWQLTDLVEFLNSLLPGRVCIGDGTFHRLDADIGNAGILLGYSSYLEMHGTKWEDPLCQRGILPEQTEKLIQAFNAPGEQLVVVKGNAISLVNLRTETEQQLTQGEVVGRLEGDNSDWKRGLTHPKAPAFRLYEKMDTAAIEYKLARVEGKGEQ